MEMTGFIVILLLNLCPKLTLAEKVPKLSLLAKEDMVYCMTEYSRSGTPAIVLQTTNLSDIVQTESKWTDSNSLVYDFIGDSISSKGTGSWHQNGGWNSANIFSEVDILPLLDFHWEGLPISDHLDRPIYFGKNWDVTISIRAREYVSMTLHRSGSLTSYNITLGVPEKDSQTHSISLCPVGSKHIRECHQKAITHRKLFDGSEWIHVTIAMRGSVLQLKLLETYNKAVPLLEIKDTKDKGTDFSSYFLTARGSPAQFRIHNYNFLGIHYRRSKGKLEFPEFKPTYYPLCIRVLSLIWPRKNSYLRVTIVHNGEEEELMTIHPLEEVAWQEVRGIYVPKNRKGMVRIRIMPQYTNYYLIGAIRECNPMGDVRVISMSTTSSKDSTFSCAFLHDQKRTVSKTSVTHIKSECSSLKKCSKYNTTCDKFSITESSCTDALLCEKTSDCCCEPKYVKPCIYKDLEAAVNLTVASVADGPNSDCIIIHWPDPCFAENFTLKSKIKRNDTWKEVEEISIKRDQSVLWDNHLHHSWCSRVNGETYKFEVNYTFRIPNLEEQHYHTEISASLSDTGPPDPPLEFKVINVSVNSVNLTWLLPLRPNGKLRYFEIKAEPKDTSLRSFTQLEVVYENCSISSTYSREYICLLKKLAPSTDYNISVKAHNMQAGQPATLQVSTLLAKPNIGPEFFKLQNSVMNGSVLIQLPPFDRNLANKSAYFLIGISHSNVMKKLENESMKNELLRKTNIENENMCWFAAELKLLLDGPMNFTVGDNSNSTGSLGSYWNRPLNPETDFTISLVAINQDDNNFEHEVRSLEFNLNALNTRKIFIIAGIVVMLLICSTLAVLIFYIKRKKIFASHSEEAFEMELEKHSGATDASDIQDQRLSNSSNLTSSKVNHPVLMKDLEAYVISILKPGVIEEQFSFFQGGLIKSCSYALLPENKAKNRYQNVIPYDDNRVRLKRTPKERAPDYINASYIDGYNSSRFYIATQGPKRTTLIDFWKMVWQEKVYVIAMATNITEKNKVVCEQYWPELQQEVRYGPFSIFNTSTRQLANFTFRVFCVIFEGSTRMVQHLQLTSWPNHRVPYIQPLAIYMKKLQVSPSGTGPIVVHCSTGSGRTGTIILADMCLRMAKAEGYVDVLGCMTKIRQQRVKTVGNVEQYKLVYLLLLECLNVESTDIPCDGGFSARAMELYETGKLHNQFENLKVVRWQDELLKYASKTQQSDAQDLENESIYSNLSEKFHPIYMDGFLSKNQFVALGLPQKAVLETFWSMVSEIKVPLIILLNDIDDINAFCPSEVHPLVLNSYLTVETKVEEDYPYWKHYSIQINNIRKGCPVAYAVSMLHFKHWPPSSELPKFPETLLELWEETQRRQEKDLGPIVLLSDTIAASGLFAAIVNVLEKVEVEHVCDVCEAVRTVHRNLDYFFTTEKQFLFLYEVVMKYLETYGIYADLSAA